MGQTPLPPAHQQPQQQPQIICPPNNGPTPRQTNGPQASVYSFFITLFHVAFSLFFSSLSRETPLSFRTCARRLKPLGSRPPKKRRKEELLQAPMSSEQQFFEQQQQGRVGPTGPTMSNGPNGPNMRKQNTLTRQPTMEQDQRNQVGRGGGGQLSAFSHSRWGTR